MSASSMTVRDPTKVWQCLQGVFCVYKPPRVKFGQLMQAVSFNLVKDLNKMEFPRKKQIVRIEGKLSDKLSVKVVPNYSSHPLSVGALYREDDIVFSAANRQNYYSSGVSLLGINREGKLCIESLKKAQLISGYEVEARLGVATSDLYYTGKPMEKSTYDHVTRSRMEKVLVGLESAHRKKMIDMMHVSPNSQEAYELLSKEGFIKPERLDDPLVYSIKLNKFRPPHFNIEIHGVNLFDEYLLTLINDIGLYSRTNAHTIKLRCFQRGPFKATEHSLIRREWTLQNVINNMALCKPLVDKFYEEFKYKIVTKEERHLIKDKQSDIEEMRKLEKESGIKLLEEYKRIEISGVTK